MRRVVLVSDLGLAAVLGAASTALRTVGSVVAIGGRPRLRPSASGRPGFNRSRECERRRRRLCGREDARAG